jgi:hypothetical protein
MASGCDVDEEDLGQKSGSQEDQELSERGIEPTIQEAENAQKELRNEPKDSKDRKDWKDRNEQLKEQRDELRDAKRGGRRTDDPVDRSGEREPAPGQARKPRIDGDKQAGASDFKKIYDQALTCLENLFMLFFPGNLELTVNTQIKDANAQNVHIFIKSITSHVSSKSTSLKDLAALGKTLSVQITKHGTKGDLGGFLRIKIPNELRFGFLPQNEYESEFFIFLDGIKGCFKKTSLVHGQEITFLSESTIYRNRTEGFLGAVNFGTTRRSFKEGKSIEDVGFWLEKGMEWFVSPLDVFGRGKLDKFDILNMDYVFSKDNLLKGFIQFLEFWNSPSQGFYQFARKIFVSTAPLVSDAWLDLEEGYLLNITWEVEEPEQVEQPKDSEEPKASEEPEQGSLKEPCS